MIDEKKLLSDLIPALNQHGDMYFAGKIIGLVDSQPQIGGWVSFGPIDTKARNLFRAKHIHVLKGNEHLNRRWIKGYLSDKTYINSPEFEGKFLIDENTVCRYTEMTDKTGEEIWENDIVEAWSEGIKAIGAVKKRMDGLWIMYPAWQGGKMWGLCPNGKGETTVRVIGNIFDNPELLRRDGREWPDSYSLH